MSLNGSEVQEFIGWIRIQEVLKPFLLSSSCCQRIHPSTDFPLQNISKLYLQFLDHVVELYCSIRSRGIEASCRSVLVMSLTPQNNCDRMVVYQCLSIFFHRQELKWKTNPQQVLVLA